MARTVADPLVDTLVKVGVRQIRGVVGDSLNPVTDALHPGSGRRQCTSRPRAEGEGTVP